MAPKRASHDADLPPMRTRQSPAKRTKASSPQRAEHSSKASKVTSEQALSEDTALAGVASFDTSAAEHDSAIDSDRDSELTQGNSSADGDDDDDEADAEYEEEFEPQQVTTLSRPSTFPHVASKPNIDPNLVMTYAKELEAKLHAFLPKLRQANSKLSEQSAKLNMERVSESESEQHIEMNLDLGVLEQQPSVNGIGAGEVKLPGEHTSGEVQSLLPPEVSIARLLNGTSEQPKPSIEVVQPGSGAYELSQRPRPMHI